MRDRRKASLVLPASAIALVAGSVWAGPAVRADCTAVAVVCDALDTTKEPPQQEARSDGERAADELLWLINEERGERGLAPMSPRDDVRAIADDHSTSMARSGRLHHNDAYFTEENRRRLDAAALGENVASGPEVEEIHRALMESDGHRAIILDARFVVVGIAAVHDGERWWVTQDFVEPRRS